VNALILFFDNLLQLSVEASTWLLLGLLIVGLMKAWVPTKIVSWHLGHGTKAIIKAVFISAPLPLCSCRVIPVATELRRLGASAPATAAFLVATPETSVDSMSVSYALLGAILAIYRPVMAIFTGIIVAIFKESFTQVKSHNTQSELTRYCAKSTTTVAAEMAKPTSSCCTSKLTKLNHSILSHSVIAKTLASICYSATQLIDDLVRWLLLGLLFATAVRTFVPTSLLLSYGSGLGAMLMMIVLSIPMYICATALTSITPGFIMASISPGTGLVSMMAGLATNNSTLGVIKNEMGSNTNHTN
jgi:uncharacterized membrane protein YraQ (UPF0718 family)